MFFTGCQNNLEKQNKEINLGAGGNTNSIDLEADNSQYLSITDADQTGLDITGDFTIEMWVKFESISPAQFFYAHYQDSTNFTNFYYNNDNNRLYFSSIDSGTWRISIYHSWTPSTNTWYHIAVVGKGGGDGVEADWKMYINAVDQGTLTLDTGSWNPTLANLGGSIYFGQQGNNSNYFDGLMDDVRRWNDIRTSTEISDNYQTELTGTETNLQGYWKLNNDLLDETSNNNDLTNNNSAVFSSDVPFTGGTTRRIIIIQ